jgi:3-oxoacyl-[acyl-carrier protein] reductase
LQFTTQKEIIPPVFHCKGYKFMNTDLRGKTALVCGASQGIGKAIALELAELGAEVIALARNREALEEVVAALPGKNQHQALELDLGDTSQLTLALEALLAKRQRPVEILVLNSGGPKPGPLAEASGADYDTAWKCHIMAAASLVSLVHPGMRAVGYGRIIGIISTSVKAPIPGLGLSNTIRGAMANWLKTLSYEVAIDGITVNSLLPGFTNTPRLASMLAGGAKRRNCSVEELRKEWLSYIPCRRFAEAKEIAQVAAFLATPAASYINGAAIAVDGGRTMAL